jgi:transcriptional regulator with XRE-family HTH domain
MTPDQIKKGRGALGLNQTEFAKLIGVRRSTVCAWEVGINPPTPRAKNIDRMKELFGRQWIGLTKEEQQQLYNEWNQAMDGWGSFYRAIEAKLKEKNT